MLRPRDSFFGRGNVVFFEKIEKKKFFKKKILIFRVRLFGPKKRQFIIFIFKNKNYKITVFYTNSSI
jgi:hypothetical protein